MRIGDRIKELRIEKGYSLREFGELLGVSGQTVRRYETGEIESIRPEMVQKIASTLGTTVWFLLGEPAGASRGTNVAELSVPEMTLLRIYRTLPDDERKLVRDLLMKLNDLHYHLYESETKLKYAEEFIGSTEYASEYEKEIADSEADGG